jgi:hypothetical protein
MATKAKGCSCYEKAAPDEPIFVLRAQDATSADTVEYWLSINPQLMHTDKGYEAQACADAMREWQDKKLAD